MAANGFSALRMNQFLPRHKHATALFFFPHPNAAPRITVNTVKNILSRFKNLGAAYPSRLLVFCPISIHIKGHRLQMRTKQ